MLGLRQEDIDYIKNYLAKFSTIHQAKVFGSRAMGTHHRGSDIDLVLFGDQITSSQISQISDHLNEESPMPYFFDVANYGTISKQALIDHIDRQGVVIYEKTLRPESQT